MSFLSGKSLVENLRQRADRVKKRLWIASPYVGSWKAVTQILGNRWYIKGGVSVRLLIDGSGTSRDLSLETVREFQKVGEVRSIMGIHAKLYVVDDGVLLTSANLTETAFARRIEAGVWLQRSESSDAVARYKNWWNSEEAEPVDRDWKPSPGEAEGSDARSEAKLKVRWPLPPLPEVETGGATVMTHEEYDCVISAIKERCKKPNLRLKILKALNSGPQSKDELDRLCIRRGNTPKTQKLYGPNGYAAYCMERLLAGPLRRCGFRITQRPAGVFELERLAG